MKQYKNILITLLKIGISLVLLYLVFRKIPFAEVWNLIQKADVVFLILGLAAFVASQVISSQRLLMYFRSYHYNLKSDSNWKLYLVGMFYNFFIPGGIGGDAYKVYLLNKKFKWSIKSLSAAVLSDRISGLVAILILIQLLVATMLPGFYSLLVFPAVIFTFFIARTAMHYFFPEFRKVLFNSLLYSFGVQLLQLLSLYFILRSFAKVDDVWIYFLVFLLSAVLSVVSFSGIGVREWLFMYASQIFHFDAGISVSAALFFSVITALVSLFGIGYQLLGLKLETDPES